MTPYHVQDGKAKQSCAAGFCQDALRAQSSTSVLNPPQAMRLTSKGIDPSIRAQVLAGEPSSFDKLRKNVPGAEGQVAIVNSARGSVNQRHQRRPQ